MNKTIEDLTARRSVRKYRPDPVPEELIDAIVRAGLYAPSAMGRQSAIILAVTDKKTRDRLAELNRSIGGWEPGFDPFYGAPAVLVVLADKSSPARVYDGSLVMGNMLNAAHALGLGSCWIHRAREEFETEEWRSLLKELGAAGEYEGIGHCILGWPDGDLPAPAPRREGRFFRI